MICLSLSDIEPIKIWDIPNFQSMFNKHLDLDKIEFLEDVTNDSYIPFYIDNTFCVFKSIEDILILVYPNKEKSIITYNIIENKIIKTIKKSS